MRRWRDALILGAVAGGLLSAPAFAQARPPEYVAQVSGAAACGPLTREIGREAVVTGRYVSRGATLFMGQTSEIDVSFCFRSIQACERFVTEMRFDYPEGTGACRPGRPG